MATPVDTAVLASSSLVATPVDNTLAAASSLVATPVDTAVLAVESGTTTELTPKLVRKPELNSAVFRSQASPAKGSNLHACGVLFYLSTIIDLCLLKCCMHACHTKAQFQLQVQKEMRQILIQHVFR